METTVLSPSLNVYTKSVPGKGRGVFAKRDLKEGELIEVCPVIVCPGSDWERLEKTALADYYLNFGDDAAVVLGFGSLYNHSELHPNARTVRKVQEKIVEFYATCDIRKDEEILFRYQCGAWWGQVVD